MNPTVNQVISTFHSDYWFAIRVSGLRMVDVIRDESGGAIISKDINAVYEGILSFASNSAGRVRVILCGNTRVGDNQNVWIKEFDPDRQCVGEVTGTLLCRFAPSITEKDIEWFVGGCEMFTGSEPIIDATSFADVGDC